MNKNLLIIISVIILIVLGAGGYMLTTRKKSSVSSPAQTTQSTGSSQSESGITQQASLKALMATNENQQCTFTDTQSGYSGTIYIGSGKSRGDFSSQVNGTTTSSHMVSDGEYIYFWTDSTPEGFKMSLASTEEFKGQISGQTTGMMDMNAQITTECSSWSPDTALFTVPADKKFTDYSALMKDASELMKKISVSPSAEGNTAGCAACASLPADAQAQCLTALSCN